MDFLRDRSALADRRVDGTVLPITRGSTGAGVQIAYRRGDAAAGIFIEDFKAFSAGYARTADGAPPI